MSPVNFNTGSAVVEDKDVAGSTYEILDTGIYPFYIEEAFIVPKESGSMGINFVLKEHADGSGKALEKTVYVQSRAGVSYYIDKKTKEERILPGFALADSIMQIVLNKKLTEITTVKMTAEIYDFDAKERVTQNVDMIKALLGKPIYLAVQKQLVNKTEKSGDDYIDTAEFIEVNEIVKAFRASDRKSITEIDATGDEGMGAFFDTWLKKNEGKIRDRRTIKTGSATAPEGAGNAAPKGSGMFK